MESFPSSRVEIWAETVAVWGSQTSIIWPSLWKVMVRVLGAGPSLKSR